MALNTCLTLALSAVLVVIDLVVRGERIRELFNTSAETVSLRDAVAVTAFADAAALLTPWRAGGEIARVAGARQVGLNYPNITATLSIEAVFVYTLAIVVGAVLVTMYGGSWWQTVVRSADPTARELPIATILGVVLAVLVIIPLAWGTRLRGLIPKARQLIVATVEACRQVPKRVLAACAAWSVISLVARVAVLPVLLAALPNTPPLGLTIFASFTLLYSQLVVPTPSGAGPVDLLFTYGGVGLEHDAVAMLVRWRAMTVALPLVIGIACGLWLYGGTLSTAASQLLNRVRQRS